MCTKSVKRFIHIQRFMCTHSKTAITQQTRSHIQQTHTHTVLYMLWQVCSYSVCVWAEQGCGLRLFSCLSMARRVGPTLWRLWSCPTSYLTCTITPVASPKTCFIGKEIFFFFFFSPFGAVGKSVDKNTCLVSLESKTFATPTLKS